MVLMELYFYKLMFQLPSPAQANVPALSLPSTPVLFHLGGFCIQKVIQQVLSLYLALGVTK